MSAQGRAKVLQERIRHLEGIIAESNELEEESISGLKNASPVGIWRSDASGRCVRANDRLCQLLGVARDEALGDGWTRALHPEDRERVSAEWRNYVEGREKFSSTYRLMPGDGRTTWVVGQAMPTINEDGVCVGHIGSIMDVTDTVTARIEVEESRAYLRNILDSMYAFVGLFSVDGRVLEANAAPLEAAGITRDMVIGRPFWDTYWWSHSTDTQEELKAALARAAQGETVRYDARIRVAEGALITIDVTFGPIYAPDGSVVQVVGSAVDVTDRQRAEEELERALFMVDQNPEPIFWVRRDGSIGHANPAASRQLGFTLDELTSMMVSDLNPTIYPAGWPTLWDKMKKAGHLRFEAQHRTKDGRVLPVEIVTGFHVYQGEEFVSGYVRDTSERKAAEEALKRNDAHLQLIADHIPAFICHLDTDLTFKFASSRYQRFFGLKESEIVGHSLVDVLGEKAHAALRETLERCRGGESATYEGELPWGPDRERRFMSATYVPDKNPEGEVVGLFGLIVDITERKMAEDRVVRALNEKDVLLKELHHRVKNNLQLMSSLLYFQSSRAKNQDASALFNESQDRVHAMALIHEALYESDDLGRVDFGLYLRRLTLALAATHGATEDEMECHVDVGPLDIDMATQCGLIVNELVTNSFKHAFPDGMPRRISVSCTRQPEQGFNLEVRDHGVGLPPGIDLQGADSLGLHLVQLLVEQMNATVAIDVAGGTHFTIQIPAKPQKEPSQAAS